ncbi:MAG: fatty acid oxidation complex subunit alpha FadB [Halobacteriovoraceae bacterium]|nr:fatty acid oxidation complex subunit alpha FadB [Halobacteriovoraceae bacterium]MCB9095458.1 fatty acid oxidation complex subunit alpha FadB [Halobacteriovoraceae bacterium]
MANTFIFQGKIWTCEVKEGIANLQINDTTQSGNVFNMQSIGEFGEALETIKSNTKIEGLLLTSAKEHFIFGADITEFIDKFKRPKDELLVWLANTNALFSSLEDLPYPSVAAINGFALGGGFEVCLACDLRIAYDNIKVGLPETKLGLIPGWGGTVRFARISGADNAMEWIAGGNQYPSREAFKIGLLDSIVSSKENLEEKALVLLNRAMRGEIDWKEKREQKKGALKLNKTEGVMAFETAKGYIKGVSGPHYPAPVAVVNSIADGWTKTRDEAIKIESNYFVECAYSETANSLINVFLGDQFLKKKSKILSKGSDKIKSAAVLGAGIMGGGIAYQTASRGIPILMKDINQAALELGLNEAGKLLTKQHERGKIDTASMNKVMGAITPCLEYGEFSQTDLVVEAIVENPEIKKTVLADVEQHISQETILASNTSTIAISELARALKRPENFCGIHFFNPVHRMPLVEIIRGEKTSEQTIAKAVQYAVQLGKTPIVVNDCPAFLVNRVLFPYFYGFVKLISEGIDFPRIDKVMEKFGWPMGPAYLLDVVGIDTAHHCTAVLAKGYPDRMVFDENNILKLMFENKRFGQKNNLGFYEYQIDRKGKLAKNYNESINKLIEKSVNRKSDLTDEEICERLMFPMIFECVRCLDEKIAESAVEVDMALLLGLGFPPFRMGPLKYADTFGLETILKHSEKYTNLGEAYKAPSSFVDLVNNKKKYYQ